MLKITSLDTVELPLKIWLGGKILIPSSSGATTSLVESFGLLIYFLPFNPILAAFCPVIFIILKSSFISVSTHIIF